jgi:S1-C subfamily serine protease
MFFLSYEQLQNSLSKVSERDKIKPQVADLSAVMREIIKAPQDSYVVLPTPESYRLIGEKQSESNNNSPTRAPQSIVTAQTEKRAIATKAEADDPEAIGRLAEAITARIEGAGPSGTGTIFRETRGVYEVFTAWHVVSGNRPNEETYVVLGNGKRYPVNQGSIKQIGESDLAILSFSPPGRLAIPQLSWQLHPKPSISVWVSGWSLATNDSPLLHRLLSGRLVSVAGSPGREGYALSYATTSPTLPGMSGGPILDEHGKLIGIHGRAERLSVDSFEGVKEIATMTSLGIPIAIYNVVP